MHFSNVTSKTKEGNCIKSSLYVKHCSAKLFSATPNWQNKPYSIMFNTIHVLNSVIFNKLKKMYENIFVSPNFRFRFILHLFDADGGFEKNTFIMLIDLTK